MAWSAGENDVMGVGNGLHKIRDAIGLRELTISLAGRWRQATEPGCWFAWLPSGSAAGTMHYGFLCGVKLPSDLEDLSRPLVRV